MFPKSAVIIPAGGTGSRMGAEMPKQFLPLGGDPVLVHVLHAFLAIREIRTIVLVIPGAHRIVVEEILSRYNLTDTIRLAEGGWLRQDSVYAGLQLVDEDTEIVLVHDGARPMVSGRLIRKCLQAVHEHGAAIAALPVIDTLKKADGNCIAGTVDRSGLWRAQTPQGARLPLLRKAFAAARKEHFVGTDEASLLENIGCRVGIVAGEEKNIKITLPEDLALAESLLGWDREGGGWGLRVGHGYDVHRFAENRELILGGVAVPHTCGLAGHSDADVVVHALCDAILGALGAGDIGGHFPDTDPQYKGIDSLKLLEKVIALARLERMTVGNADLTVVAQQPRLAPYIPQMRRNLAAACRVASAVVNVKATTTEGLGFTGRQEGIAAHAVVLLFVDKRKGIE